MFDVRKIINGKPPLTLNPIYYKDSGTLKIYFIGQPPTTTLQNNSVVTDIKDIKVERDNTGRIICILFCNAEKRIAKPKFEEEREKLARISEKKAEEFTKKQYEIIKKYL
jgi:hypothetical protein